MAPLTDWVMRHAIAKAALWRDAGLMIPVAVNISPRTLLDRELSAEVLRLLADAGLPAHVLELEVTETAIMTDLVCASLCLRHLQAMGTRVAIDGFGVGCTSLAYLKSLPVDTLMIDATSSPACSTAGRDQVIAESVIGLGHKLGFTILAEGIGDEAVMDRLRSLDCDEGQGSSPRAPDAIRPARRFGLWGASSTRAVHRMPSLNCP